MVASKASGSGNAVKERRQFERFATRLDVQARRDDLTPRAQTSRTAQCRMALCDFSLDGLRAECPIRLKTGEHVTVRLPPNGAHPPLELTGRVVHCRRQHDRYQIGIQFSQTRQGATESPWWQLPRLFSLAHSTAEESRLDYLPD
ncbi:MAG: PilZ domain-containing protein [Phycisphaerae bacterium]|nr:PilZ domain-containing protein [Phycisphaerae bacterium]